jgi:hypothetical protein
VQAKPRLRNAGADIMTKRKRRSSAAGTAPKAKGNTAGNSKPTTKQTATEQGHSPALVAALDYAAARGWFVFPGPVDIKKSYKSAEFSGGRKWGMTRDHNEIIEDFTHWPNATVNVPTGAINDIFDLETDTAEGHGEGVDGAAALRALEGQHSPLPVTLMACSPTGSVHRIFKHPGARYKVKSSDSELGPGIDVRGDGGMFRAPPSLHANGGHYKWLNPGTPIAEAPDWLLRLVIEEPRQRQPAPVITVDPHELKEIRDWLRCIYVGKGSYGNWYRVATALRNDVGDDLGFELFDEWSQYEPAIYNARLCEQKWLEVAGLTDIHIGTIYHLAEENNFEPIYKDDQQQEDDGNPQTTDKVEAVKVGLAKDGGPQTKDNPPPPTDEGQPTPNTGSITLDLATKLWGPGARVGVQWQFNGGKQVVQFNSRGDNPQWFDFTTGRGGNFDALLKLVQAQGGAKTADNEPLIWHGDQTANSVRWLVKGLLPETGVAMIAGQWGTGKTFSALDLAGSVMFEGQRFIDYRVARHGGVLYIAGEGFSGLPLRIAAMLAAKLNKPIDEILPKQPLCWRRYSGKTPLLWPGGLEQLKTLVLAAKEEMRARFDKELVLIIIDTIGVVAGWENENDAAEAQRVAAMLETISALTGALVVQLDHYGKDIKAGTRGSSAKEGHVDNILTCLADLDDNRRHSNHRLVVSKVREGEEGRIIPFRLEMVNCGVDEDGDQVTTRTIHWQPDMVLPPAAQGGRPARAEPIFRRAVIAAFATRATTVQVNGAARQAVRREDVLAAFVDNYIAQEGCTEAAAKEAFRRLLKDALREPRTLEAANLEGVTWLQQVL